MCGQDDVDERVDGEVPHWKEGQSGGISLLPIYYKDSLNHLGLNGNSHCASRLTLDWRSDCKNPVV
jgi:hypothetical protein